LITALARGRLETAVQQRALVSEEFFAREAPRIARLCHRCAERFARGARILAVGSTPAGRSDARHVAVEFVHPVMVGKRALPAIALTPEAGPVDRALALLAAPEDIVIAFDADEAVAREAMRKGCLTIGFGDHSEWCFDVPTRDPHVRQELIETLYHVVWELVHVFFEHRGLLRGRRPEPVHDAGSASFLYPFLAEQELDLDTVLAEVEASIRMKATEATELRRQTVLEGGQTLVAGAAELHARYELRGRLLIAGNGGSATDAMDLAADLRFPLGPWPPRPALDLTEDTAVLTAVANDIGAESIFSRQVIAQGRREDMLLVISTSGSSDNLLAALAEARRAGLATMAMVGYDGGRITAEQLADWVIVTRSEHIPRIQEAQATACHLLRELIEAPSG